MEFLKKLIPAIGLLIGIVFVAIGGTMTLSNSFKLAFSKPVAYDPIGSCEYKYIPASPEGVKQTPAQISECTERVIADQKAQYIQQKTDSIIDGGAFLLVGAFFWLMFRKREHN